MNRWIPYWKPWWTFERRQNRGWRNHGWSKISPIKALSCNAKETNVFVWTGVCINYHSLDTPILLSYSSPSKNFLFYPGKRRMTTWHRPTKNILLNRRTLARSVLTGIIQGSHWTGVAFLYCRLGWRPGGIYSAKKINSIFFPSLIRTG